MNFFDQDDDVGVSDDYDVPSVGVEGASAQHDESFDLSSFRETTLSPQRRARSPALSDILGPNGAGAARGPADDETLMGQLLRAWSNEKAAPELLYYPRELVEAIVERLATRKERLAEAQRMEDQSEAFYIQLGIVGMECVRMSWALKGFLRERIFKIEKYARHYLQPDLLANTKARLYPNEFNHARGYLELVDDYLKTSGLNEMPERMRELDSDEMLASPDLSKPVFVRVREDCGTVVTPGGELLELNRGDQHLLRYSTIRRLLQDEKVELVA